MVLIEQNANRSMSQDTLPFSVERSDNGPKFTAEAVRE